MLSPIEKSRPKLLVIDDRPEQFEIIRLLLRPLGDAYHAVNGLDAFILASERVFDAVLIDVVLGDVNGLKVASALRKGKYHPTAPIIAYSADWSTTNEDIIAYGCNDFVKVPFAEGELESKVRFWLNRKVIFPPKS